MTSNIFLPVIINTGNDPISITLLIASLLLFLSAIFYFFDKRIESLVFIVLMGFIVSAFMLLNLIRAILKTVDFTSKKIWRMALSIITVVILFVCITSTT